MAKQFIFETKPCGRCGGSGHYSYNQMSGSRCFGCGGNGVRLSKRGNAAQTYYRSLLSCRLGDLKVGDLMQVDSMSYTYFAPIVSIGEPYVYGSSNGRDMIGIDVTTESPKYGRSGLTASPDTIVRKGATALEKNVARAKALAYQNTYKGKK